MYNLQNKYLNWSRPLKALCSCATRYIHWLLSQWHTELENAPLVFRASLIFKRSLEASVLCPWHLIILCSQKEVGTFSIDLQLLLKFAIMVTVVPKVILSFLKPFWNHSLKNAPVLFFLVKTNTAGHPREKHGLYRTLVLYFLFQRYFYFSKDTFMELKNTSAGLLTVGFSYMVTMLYKKNFFFQFSEVKRM